VRHLPNALASWPLTFADLCRALGSSLDCASGCSPIRLAVTNYGGGTHTAANAVRFFTGLPAHQRPVYPPMDEEHCVATSARVGASTSSHSAGALTSSPAEEGVWGAKTPHSIFFLSFYHALLGPTFRFVHVVRDGRDLAFGSTNNAGAGASAAATHAQFDLLCPHMYGTERCAAATLSPPPTSDISSSTSTGGSVSGSSHGSGVASTGSGSIPSIARAALMLEWWGDVNMQAYKWAKAHMKPSSQSSSSPRYLLLRVEDLALSANNATEATTLARLLQFAGVTRANYASGSWASDVLVASSVFSSSSGQSQGRAAGPSGESSAAFPPSSSSSSSASASAGGGPSAALCAAVQHHGLGAYPFGGNKYSADDKKRFLDAVGTSGQAAIRHFGYDPDQWGVGLKRSHAADLDSTVLGDFHNHPDATWYVDLVANALRACDSTSTSGSRGGNAGSSDRSDNVRLSKARAAKREASLARLKAAAAKLKARGSEEHAANTASFASSAFAASSEVSTTARTFHEGAASLSESSTEVVAALPGVAPGLEDHPLHGTPGFQSFAQRFGVGYSTHPKEHAHASIDAVAAAVEGAPPASRPGHGAHGASSTHFDQDAQEHGAGGAAAGASFADRFGLQGGKTQHHHQQHHHLAVPAAGVAATGAGTDDFFGVSSAVSGASATVNRLLPRGQAADGASLAVAAATGEVTDVAKAKLRAAAIALNAQYKPAQVIH